MLLLLRYDKNSDKSYDSSVAVVVTVDGAVFWVVVDSPSERKKHILSTIYIIHAAVTLDYYSARYLK